MTQEFDALMALVGNGSGMAKRIVALTLRLEADRDALDSKIAAMNDIPPALLDKPGKET